jgi:hypothetical protein
MFFFIYKKEEICGKLEKWKRKEIRRTEPPFLGTAVALLQLTLARLLAAAATHSNSNLKFFDDDTLSGPAAVYRCTSLVTVSILRWYSD